MNVFLEFMMTVLISLCGICAWAVRDLLGAAILFGAYSFMMCLLWVFMGAPDVALTEAAVGAGISTILYVAAVFHTSRKSKD